MDTTFMVAIAVGLVSLALYFIVFGIGKKPTKEAAAETKSTTTKKSPVTSPKVTREPKEYTAEEVAKHNKRNDLWLIVEGKVYDLTSFVDTHPGGDAILNNPGQDNTSTIFHDQHPESVRDQLNEYYIGTVKN